MKNKFKVKVLLASFNGLPWIRDQISSIVNQKNIDVSLVISDDCSEDSTADLIIQTVANSKLVTVLPTKKQGGAATNFFRLIRDADLSNIEYLALSDQDDIWLENKLSKAIELILENNVDGYSSNVTAFWTNGSQKLINKAQSQQEYDFMFESAGPGCTFVITKELAFDLQSFLIENESRVKEVALHDWFIYAFARSHGYSWFIDKEPHMLYRQHDKNVVGANIGIKAKKERWKKMREGWHVKQALLIADILGYSDSFPIKELKNYSFIDRVRLIANVRKLRRRLRDCFALAIFFLFPLKK
jgi:rhamnosyltransferase